MTKFYDLDFTQSADGTVLLIQSDCGEDYSIAAHPQQIKFIAQRLRGMTSNTVEQVADLERRIAVLTDKLQRIVCNGVFRGNLIERCGDGFEYLAKLDSVLDLALEFDGGRLEPEYRGSEQQEDHSAAKSIYPCPTADQAKKKRPSAIAEVGEQLGLAG